MRILNTRPIRHADSFSEKLAEKNIEVVQCPLLEYLPPENLEVFYQAIHCIQPMDWCFFVSQQAIDVVLPILKSRLTSLEKMQFACMGKSSALSLQSYGVKRIIQQARKISSSEDLLARLNKEQLYQDNIRIYYFCGDIGRRLVPEQLRRWGIPCQTVISYRTGCPSNASSQLKIAFNHPIDAILITSEQILNSLYHCAKQENIELSTILHIVISERLRDLAKKAGAVYVVIAASATSQDVLSAIPR